MRIEQLPLYYTIATIATSTTSCSYLLPSSPSPFFCLPLSSPVSSLPFSVLRPPLDPPPPSSPFSRFSLLYFSLCFQDLNLSIHPLSPRNQYYSTRTHSFILFSCRVTFADSFLHILNCTLDLDR
ncbi:hypothetical protein BOTBODRAFT_491773 [Botryobasidium botryosum FD-172 SS1]|uniref:Uncharacterized protein n=1 Tax=Botryobasidium botryosum (strain FD-172 SS1) TaxID=930990 RepID=A0A067M6X9_BOTB1|nr:hypothetical protein BOTBODRAFT_491773 [Botryobasidium botryosum FD-172 SS1]